MPLTHSPSITALAKALVAAQAEFPTVGYDSENPHFKSRYASLTAIIETIKPILHKHGLAVVQAGSALAHDHSPADAHVRSLTVETYLFHESGEYVASAVTIPIDKANPQGAVAAVSYGRRCGLSACLSLATDEDDDGNAAAAVDVLTKATQAVHAAAARTTPSAAPAKPAAPSTSGRGVVKVPFGDTKGTPITEVGTTDLQKQVDWIRKGGEERVAKFQTYLNAVIAEINSRAKPDRGLQRAAPAKCDGTGRGRRTVLVRLALRSTPV